MSYAHKVVIHDVCKVIGWHTVALKKNLILQILEIDGYAAVNHIFIAGLTFRRNILPDNVQLACGKFFLNFFL